MLPAVHPKLTDHSITPESQTKLSKKVNVPSLSTAFIFSKLTMCKYLYEHNKIQQLRHKLNKFHRNGQGGKVKIKIYSQYLVWPPAALSTAAHLLLMDCSRFSSYCCEMLPHSSTKAPASSRTVLGGMALALTVRFNRSQTCSMGLRYGLFAGHGRALTFLSCRKSRTERAVWLVALSCWRVRSG